MNLFDFFLLIILLGAGVLGYKRGIIVQIASMVTMLVAFLIAYLFTDELAPLITDIWGSDVSEGGVIESSNDSVIDSAIAFFVLFLGTSVILSFFTSLFHRLARFPILKTFNRLGGILFSLLQVLIMSLIICYIGSFFQWEWTGKMINESAITQILFLLTPWLHDALQALFLNAG